MAAIPYNCKGCGRSGKAPDKYAGRKIRCPGCKKPMRLPSLDFSDDSLHPDDQAPPEVGASREQRASRSASSSGSTRKARSSSAQHRRSRAETATSSKRSSRSSTGKSASRSGAGRRVSSSGTTPAAPRSSSSRRTATGSDRSSGASDRAQKASGRRPAKKRSKIGKVTANWKPAVQRRKGAVQNEASATLIAARGAKLRKSKLVTLVAVGTVVGVIGTWLLVEWFGTSMARSAITAVSQALDPQGNIAPEHPTIAAVSRGAGTIAVLPEFLTSKEPKLRQAAAAIIGAWDGKGGANSKPIPELEPLLEVLKDELIGSKDRDRARDVRAGFAGTWDSESLNELFKLMTEAKKTEESLPYEIANDPENQELQARLDKAKSELTWYVAFFRKRGAGPQAEWSGIKTWLREMTPKPPADSASKAEPTAEPGTENKDQ